MVQWGPLYGLAAATFRAATRSLDTLKLFRIPQSVCLAIESRWPSDPACLGQVTPNWMTEVQKRTATPPPKKSSSAEPKVAAKAEPKQAPKATPKAEAKSKEPNLDGEWGNISLLCLLSLGSRSECERVLKEVHVAGHPIGTWTSLPDDLEGSGCKHDGARSLLLASGHRCGND